MTDFPMVGLGVDLSGIAEGEAAYDRLQAKIDGVAVSAQTAGAKIQEALGGQAVAAQAAGTESAAAATRSATAAETAAARIQRAQEQQRRETAANYAQLQRLQAEAAAQPPPRAATQVVAAQTAAAEQARAFDALTDREIAGMERAMSFQLAADARRAASTAATAQQQAELFEALSDREVAAMERVAALEMAANSRSAADAEVVLQRVTAADLKMWQARREHAVAYQAQIDGIIDQALIFADARFAQSMAAQKAEIAAQQAALAAAGVRSTQDRASVTSVSAPAQMAEQIAATEQALRAQARAAAETSGAAAAAMGDEMAMRQRLRAQMLGDIEAETGETVAKTAAVAATRANTAAMAESVAAGESQLRGMERLAAAYLAAGGTAAGFAKAFTGNAEAMAAFNKVSSDSAVLTEDMIARAEKMKATLDPLYAAQVKYNATIAELATLSEAGAISETERLALLAKAEKAYRDVASAGSVSSLTIREFMAALREMGRGDLTRLPGTLSLLGQSLGLVTGALVQTVVVVAAAAAPFVILGLAISKAQKQVEDFNNALKATGGFAGISFDQFQANAEKIAASTNSALGGVLKAEQAVVASGKVTGASITLVTDAAVRLANLTGENASKTAGKLSGFYGEASKKALELNDSVHFLTAGLYGQIQAAEQSGDKTKAFQIAMQGLDDFLASEGNPHLDGLNGLLHGIHIWFDQVINDTESWLRVLSGVPTAVDQIKDAQAGLARHPAQPTWQQDLMNGLPTVQGFQNFWDLGQGHDRNFYLQELAVGQARQTQDNLTAQQKADQATARDRQLSGVVTLGSMVKSLRTGDPTLIEQQKKEFWDSVTNAQNGASALTPDQQQQITYALSHRAQIDAEITRRYSRQGGSRTDGIQNQIAKTLAEVDGMNQQVDAMLAHPGDALADYTAQIDKARKAAEAASSHGARSAFAQSAGDAAALKEEATLRLHVVDAADKQTRAYQQQAAQTQISSQGEAAAFAALQQYYQGGTGELRDFLNAQDKANDAILAAKEKLNAYTIAQRFGVTSMDQISAAWQRATGASKDEADGVEQAAKAELAAADAADVATDKINREAEARRRLTEASIEYDRAIQNSKVLQLQAGESGVQRDAEAYVQVIANKLMAENRNLTLEAARAEAMREAVMRQEIDDMARLTIELQSQIRDTFIQTGKLDFSGLRKGMTEALRKAIYDSLIAKPIDIIVRAEVSMINKLTDQFFQPFENSLTSSLGNLFGMGGGGGFNPLTGGYGDASRTAMDQLVNASTGLEDATANLTKAGSGGVGGFFGNLFSNGIAGAANPLLALTSVLGGGSKIGAAATTGLMASMGASLGGSALGFLGGQAILAGGAGALGTLGMGLASLSSMLTAFAGPIGIVVALASMFLGSKPSNHASLSTLTENSYTVQRTNKSNDDTMKMADAFSQSVLQAEAVLKSAGVTTKGYVSGIDIGSRDQPNVSFSTGEQLRLGNAGDPASALDAAMKHLLQGATYASDAEKKLVDSMLAAGDGFDAIATKLKEFAQAQDFLKGVDRSILKIQDPQAAALSDLRDQQIARRQQAITYYKDGVLSSDQLTALNDKLKVLEKLEIQQTIDQFSNGLSGATATLQEFNDAQKKVIDYANGLLVGNLSPLSPMDQLAQAQSQFYALLAKAQGGDKGAFDQINGASDTYLQQARSIYASSPGYANIFNQVESALQSLGTQAYPSSTNSAGQVSADSQAVVEALAQLQSAITQSNADLITATSPASNDNATGADITDQTSTLVGALQGVQQTIAASTEAITYAINGQTYTAPLNLSQLMAGGAI